MDELLDCNEIKVLRPELLKQFKDCEGKKTCLLVLGKGPQYDQQMPSNISVDAQEGQVFTLLLLGAVARQYDSTIALDVRKECRKIKSAKGKNNRSSFEEIDLTELNRLLCATRLQIPVARKEYGIECEYCFAFSTSPCRIADCLDIPKVVKSEHHLTDCYLGTTPSRSPDHQRFERSRWDDDAAL